MASMPPISSTGTTPMNTYARIKRLRSSHSVSLASRNTTRTISRKISTVRAKRSPPNHAQGARPNAIGSAAASVAAPTPKISLNSQEWRSSSSIRRVRARAWAAEAWGGPVWVSTVGMTLPLDYRNPAASGTGRFAGLSRATLHPRRAPRGLGRSPARWPCHRALAPCRPDPELPPRRDRSGGLLQRLLHPAVFAAVQEVHDQPGRQPDEEDLLGDRLQLPDQEQGDAHADDRHQRHQRRLERTRHVRLPHPHDPDAGAHDGERAQGADVGQFGQPAHRQRRA